MSTYFKAIYYWTCCSLPRQKLQQESVSKTTITLWSELQRVSDFEDVWFDMFWTTYTEI